jgi:hypothetical protein
MQNCLSSKRELEKKNTQFAVKMDSLAFAQTGAAKNDDKEKLCDRS